MSDPMLVDAHEPNDIFRLLSQSIPCVQESINERGYADYKWSKVDTAHAQHPHCHQQVERKTWMELLGNMDAVEDQLRRQRQAHPDVDLSLLVEGVATSSGVGTVVWLPSKSTTKRIMFPAKEFRLPLQAAYAWLYQVHQYMDVYLTPDMASTATALVAFYKADQKDEHTTFHRYLRTIDFHPNPQVEGLMNMMKGTDIGAARAQALINRFGTIWNTVAADPRDIAAVQCESKRGRLTSIGLSTAQQLLRKVGRPDV